MSLPSCPTVDSAAFMIRFSPCWNPARTNFPSYRPVLPPMKKLLFCVLIFAVQIVSSFGQAASTSPIKGVVKDINGAVISGARVSLLSPSGRELASFTDREGNFLFENLAAGEYRLQVSADGFSGSDRTVRAETGSSLEEIILSVGGPRFSVTAEVGQSEDRADIPQPINIIGPVQIRERATTFLAQIAKEEVGLNVQRTSPTIGAIVVRGLTGKNVVNFVDGVRYTNGAQRGGINTFFNLNDASNIQSVEVLRGPNSAQYGSDSLGGTVNLLTRSPAFGIDDPEFHGEINPTYTSADRGFGASGLFSYSTRRFGGYVSFGARRANTLRTSNEIDSHSAITRFLGLPSTVLYDRSPDTEFTQYSGATRLNYALTDRKQLIFFYQRGQQDDGKRFDQLLGGDGNLIADLRNLMLDFGYFRFVKQDLGFFDSVSFTVSYNSQREE